jgi:hypothetical protein
MIRAKTALAAVVAVASGFSGAARAYDPATTHAGLTERASLASTLNHVLASALGKPLGLFETVTLDPRLMPAAEARELRERLAALDPAQGYRPGDDGSAMAMSWVVAGAVLAGTPGDRVRNTFFDPSRKVGMQQGGSAAEIAHSVRLVLDAGGSLRGLATGTSFDLSGMPATEWLVSPANDGGLVAFYAQLEKSVTEAAPAARSTALARALLALGGTLGVLEDAGEPAHVRNDFREAYLNGGSGSPFDRSSAFERYVAETYGRSGVPAPGAPVDRPDVLAFVSAPDSQGLADRTQRRFFSPGSLPTDAVVDRDTNSRDVLLQARDSLPYGLPGIPRLELQEMGHLRYVETADGPGEQPKRRLLAYQRVPGRVRFFLNAAVYADSARLLLPEIGAYAAGLINHLFRVDLTLAVKGTSLTAKAVGVRGSLRDAIILIHAEDGHGQRTLIANQPFNNSAETTINTTIPTGTRRLAAVLKGVDQAGQLIAVVDRSVP